MTDTKGTDSKSTDSKEPISIEQAGAEPAETAAAAKKPAAKKPAAKKPAAPKTAAKATAKAAADPEAASEAAPAAKKPAAKKPAAKKTAVPKAAAAKTAGAASKEGAEPASAAAAAAAPAAGRSAAKSASPKRAGAAKPAGSAAKSAAGKAAEPAAKQADAAKPAAKTGAAAKSAAKKTGTAKTATAAKKTGAGAKSAATEQSPAAAAPAAIESRDAPASDAAPLTPAQAKALPGAESREPAVFGGATGEAPAQEGAFVPAKADEKAGLAAGREAPKAREQAPDAPDDAAGDALADFPSNFGDTGPEDFFAEHDDQPDSPAEGGERKRRGRSRRGGRGRKKNDAGAGGAEAAAPAADDAAKGLADERHDEAPDQEEDGAAAGRPSEDKLPLPAGKGSRRKMFVSVVPGEQVEVVITEEGQVQEYYVEMLHQAKTKGNIYKGVVHNVDPNLQAAFISYGAVKNGFLQIDEVHPEYYVTVHEASKGRKYPPVQKVLKAGQELLVQVVKEPAGTKGAFLSTYLSLAGRFLVLTPGREQIGVSRKVDDEPERSRLRDMLEGLNPGPGLGVIVRTVSMGASKTNLQRDLQFLKRTWKEVRTRGTTEQAPCLVHQEVDLTSRAVRDYLTESIGELWIDDEATAASVTEISEALFPRKQSLVRVHKDAGSTLFERFNLQRQLDQIHSREVSLPSGGRLVIDPTEALTAIDINSGRSSGKNNFEDMAYRTNMEAARMIPLQLRLRDIGGQVVADFIEMRDKSHWREVEKTLRNGMKVDRARYDVGKIGPFGMMEIVRQRLGSSAISISTEPCPCCNGTGVRRNMEWQSQHALRDILRLLRTAQAQSEESLLYEVEQPLALHLLNNKRRRLAEMEKQFGVRLEIAIKAPDLS